MSYLNSFGSAMDEVVVCPRGAQRCWNNEDRSRNRFSLRSLPIMIFAFMSSIALFNVITSVPLAANKIATNCPEESRINLPTVTTTTQAGGKGSEHDNPLLMTYSVIESDLSSTPASSLPFPDFWRRHELPDTFATPDAPSPRFLSLPSRQIEDEHTIEIVIGVLSGRGDRYAQRRQTIRELWLSELSEQKTISIRLGHNKVAVDIEEYGCVARNDCISFRIKPVFFVGTDFCPVSLPYRTYQYRCEVNADLLISKSKKKTLSIENATKMLQDFANSTITRVHMKNERKETQSLYDEAVKNGDMVLLNVQDFYHNSPVKVATFFGWVLNTTNAHYVMKMDDDVFLDWRLLLQRLAQQQHHELRTLSTNSNATTDPSGSRTTSRDLWWWGNLRVNTPVQRDPTFLWGISKTDYTPDVWAPYMSGGANVLNRNTIEYVVRNYDASLQHAIFGEDVAMGAWLASTHMRYAHDNQTFQRHPDKRECKASNSKTYATLFIEFCHEVIMERIEAYQTQRGSTSAKTTTAITSEIAPQSNGTKLPNEQKQSKLWKSSSKADLASHLETEKEQKPFPTADVLNSTETYQKDTSCDNNSSNCKNHEELKQSAGFSRGSIDAVNNGTHLPTNYEETTGANESLQDDSVAVKLKTKQAEAGPIPRRRSKRPMTATVTGTKAKADIHLRQSVNPRRGAPAYAQAKPANGTVPTAAGSTQRASCGIYYFYHVGKCGGESVQRWQKSFTTSGDTARFQHLDWYLVGTNGEYNSVWREGFRFIEDLVLHNMTTQSSDSIISLKNLNTASNYTATKAERHPLQWLSVHQHHQTPGLRYLMPKLRKWKQRLVSIGCDLILTTVLRNPFSRAKSILSYNSIPEERFQWYISTKFEGQARYLLYNSCKPGPKGNGTQDVGIRGDDTRRQIISTSPIDDRNEPPPPEWCTGPGITSFYLGSTSRNRHYQSSHGNTTSNATGATKGQPEEGEIEELIQYLGEFDLIGRTADLDSFLWQSESLTGWENMQELQVKRQVAKLKVLPGKKKRRAPHLNKSRLQYNITDDMKQLMIASLETDQILWDAIFPSNSTPTK